jgi:hypothetical protein
MHLRSAVAIIDLLSGIAGHGTDKTLHQKLSEAALQMLRKDWSASSEKKRVTIKTTNLERLLTVYLKYATDPLTALEELTQDVAAGPDEQTNKHPSWPTMSKTSTNTFYKCAFTELSSRFIKFNLAGSSHLQPQPCAYHPDS